MLTKTNFSPRGHILNIVDIFSIGASISTMIGLLIAIVSLWNYYREKREKLEYEVKKDFFEGIDWECIGENGGLGSFSLSLNRAPFFKMSGEIEYFKTIDVPAYNIEDILFFEVKGVCKKELTIEIHQLKEISDVDLKKEILGMATLQHVNPHEFTMTLNENCLPQFPRIVSLYSYEYYHRLDRAKQRENPTRSIDEII